MPQVGNTAKLGVGVTICNWCGASIRFLPRGVNERVAAYDMQNDIHKCTPPKAKIYSSEEKLEFARMREAGQI